MLQWIMGVLKLIEDNHKEWLFDGAFWAIISGIFAFIVYILGFFRRKYKIIKRVEYNQYIAMKDTYQDYTDLDKLKKDLKYDEYDEVYYKKKPNEQKEYFCPKCLDADHKLIRVSLATNTTGNRFICKNCNNDFGKGLYSVVKPKTFSIYNDRNLRE